jgi:hypothetical protein
VFSNPFGVVFHPVPLARFIRELLKGPVKERIIRREDVFLSMDAGSEVYAMSETALSEKLSAIREQTRAMLEVAQTLIVTLGSAHGYRTVETGEIAANCHKLPQRSFEKVLTPLADLASEWNEALELLKLLNPDLNVIFTGSPVRYSRDGLVENTRSKARLFELITVLEEQQQVQYFPAFELVNDLLRDYRYFEKDGVHPNALAIEKVWELFGQWYFSETTTKLVKEIVTLRQMEQHRLLFPESAAATAFLEKLHEKRESFLSLHPYIIW